MRFTRRRKLVLALAIAGVAGGSIASWPASATPPRELRGTVDEYFFRDGPEPISDNPFHGQIAAVVLPKGSWVVTVKLMITSTPTIPVGTYPLAVASCGMDLGSGPSADTDLGVLAVPLNAAGMSGSLAGTAGTVVMTASHTFTEAGTLTVTCFGSQVQYQFLRIEALKVASIVRTQI